MHSQSASPSGFKVLLGLVSLILGSNPAFAAGPTITGVIRAQEEVIVRSEASGIVQRIVVKEGDRVQGGQVLVELRNERQRISLDLSRAGLAKATASMEETTVVLESAERELSRVKTAADSLPRKELEDKTDQVLRLKANLNAQMAELAQAKEEVKLKEQELKETQLLAPFSGTVTQILINRGDSLKPLETPVLELVALEQLYAELLVPSNYLEKIHKDQTVKVQVESEWMGRPGQVEGKVIYVNPTIDAPSRTFKVKIGIPNSNGLVRPGMIAQVLLEP